MTGIPQKTLRSIPSQANPSILLGERVDTEDDILHIRNLPDFDGTLGMYCLLLPTDLLYDICMNN